MAYAGTGGTARRYVGRRRHDATVHQTHRRDEWGFGGETFAVLKQFQAKHGLAADGIIGHDTLAD